MNKVENSDLHAKNTERAMKFYNKVFQWQAACSEDEGYYHMRTINTIEVTCVDEFIKKMTKHGGQVVVPKFELEDIGLMAYCKDTEENIFGIYTPLEK
ncbi:hypothetical protein [Bacillus cereus group sp. FL70]|uniref:VOC family protein n=1 Tax=Bacillus cereus group sp. FL70 TaxID=3040254 RepID=UPI003398333C